MNGDAGLYTRAVCEFVILACLYFAKAVPRLRASQKKNLWDVCTMQILRGKTLGVVGFGCVGQSAARMAHGLGMRVLAMRCNPFKSTDNTSEQLCDNGCVLPPSDANVLQLCAESDFILVAVPLTKSTSGMITHRHFAKMKQSCVLVSVSRGAIVDEHALVSALRKRLIRGVATDVRHDEPLPEKHPFYTMDNTLIYSASIANIPGLQRRAIDMFVQSYGNFGKIDKDGKWQNSRVVETRGY